MNIKPNIADSELPIIKILWEYEQLTQPQIYEKLGSKQNKSTFKTLLSRLVSKGAVKVDKLNTRSFIYSAIVTRAEYIEQERTGFLQRVFDGSKNRMLLNFVKEEKISREELQKLMDSIDKVD